MKVYLITMIFLFAASALAQTKVAVVKKMRGEVIMVQGSNKIPLTAEAWVTAGSMIETKNASFVQIVFSEDKSLMSIGPNSQMKIERFGKDDAGVIDLVKGQIRSQVTKDYLKEKEGKSKVFVKTQNAVMGIRGTDFMITTNGQNTAAILFEGNVRFNNLRDTSLLDSTKLDAIVNRGVIIRPHEFSTVSDFRPEPTVPSVLNVQQFEQLEKNKDFGSSRTPQTQSSIGEEHKSVVPKGLSGTVVASNTDVIKDGVKVETPASEVKGASSAEAAGFEKDGKLKPANGSFLHLASGTVIPPAANSVFDKNTNSFLSSSENGKVDSDGNYIPPKNVEISDSGKILVTTIDKESGKTVVNEIKELKPIVNTDAGTARSANGDSKLAPVTLLNPTGAPVLPASQQLGGITPTQSQVDNVVNSAKTPVHVIVKPPTGPNP